VTSSQTVTKKALPAWRDRCVRVGNQENRWQFRNNRHNGCSSPTVDMARDGRNGYFDLAIPPRPSFLLTISLTSRKIRGSLVEHPEEDGSSEPVENHASTRLLFEESRCCE